jgi:hypothetical protein
MITLGPDIDFVVSGYEHSLYINLLEDLQKFVK